MIVFLDASALAKRYVEEAGSPVVLEFLSKGPCAVSRLSEVEVASALCRRHREKELGVAQRDTALAALKADCQDLYVVEITPFVTARSAELLVRHPLRAADALQLASCLELRDELRELGTRMLAFDQRLLEAAAREGLPIVETHRAMK